MRAKLSSVTALVVAAVRAMPRDVEHAPVDPLAARMLPWPMGALAQRVAQWTAHDRTLVRLVPTASVGLVDHIALRTLVIDDVCERATKAGLAQVVILGAGFDTRAYRLPCLHDAHVFEVDHPATFRAKQARAKDLRAIARAHTAVPIDFEREELGATLARAGHDPHAPTLWIWEGVTMYLHEHAIDATLQTIGERSAAGSQLVMSYGPPDFAPSVFHVAARGVGEPVRCMLTPAQVEHKLRAVGFTLAEDSGPAEWLARFGGGGWIVARERVALAKREPVHDER